MYSIMTTIAQLVHTHKRHLHFVFRIFWYSEDYLIQSRRQNYKQVVLLNVNLAWHEYYYTQSKVKYLQKICHAIRGEKCSCHLVIEAIFLRLRFLLEKQYIFQVVFFVKYRANIERCSSNGSISMGNLLKKMALCRMRYITEVQYS